MASRTVLGFISTQDHRLMRRMNRWRPPRWFRVLVLLASRFGDGWLWYGVGLAVLFFGGPQSYIAVLAGGLGVCASSALFLFLKKFIGRPRPCMPEAHCWAELLPPDQFSFPSGHTMTAFAVALSLGHFYPSLLSPLVLMAAMIGLSRLALGMHFLSDVVAGAALGATIGAGAARFYSLWLF
jgi:undecaprenyl-diphosphatase